LFEVKPQANMKIITGAAITAIKVIMIKVFKNFVPIWLMTFWTSSCVSLALASDKIGMNACENALRQIAFLRS